MTRTLRIDAIDRSRHQLSMRFALDDDALGARYRFATSYWYEDVDWDTLAARFGENAIERLAVHIACFEVNKIASLRPDALDLGPYARWHTAALEELWREVFRRVWAQWRWEHQLPDYEGPRFVSSPRAASIDPLTRPASDALDALVFCGGGKDSLVAMRLLERAGVPHAALAYSHSVYGRAAPQHRLIDALLDVGPARARHRLSMYDDFLDAPVAALAPELGVRSLLAAETPSSMFAAVPILLAHGHRSMVLAHEHSANVGNLVWDRTGEDVNHQWGKSLAAERLLDTYLRRELLADARYWSALQPAHDVLIFQLLAADPRGVERTHSCNVDKPWCERCAKCAYVWLHYMAHLPVDRVAPMFRTNLFDADENLLAFRRMLGLEDHTPFECIGEIGEVKLAFELCRRKGLRGRAMAIYERDVPPFDAGPLLDRYLRVHADASRAPEPLASALRARMEEVSARARATLGAALAGAGPPRG